MRSALIQLQSGDDPEANLKVTQALIDDAVNRGAGFVLTPEVTNCVSSSRTRQEQVLRPEPEDITLAALRAQARARGIWILIGSLALKTGDADGRYANRSFMIGPDGGIVARYDKIHMFDVEIDAKESYRESEGYRPGAEAVVAATPFGPVGMTVCYDVRFPALYSALVDGGAKILTVPAAFSPVTGAAHWHVLLRARAIETGCYVLAPAQGGDHAVARGRPRCSYGHSLAVTPWGEVLTEGAGEPAALLFDIDPEAVAQARKRVPSMTNRRAFTVPR